MLPFTDQSKVLPKRPTICCVASVYRRSVSRSTPSMSKTTASAGRMSAPGPARPALLDEGALRLAGVIRAPERTSELLLAAIGLGQGQVQQLSHAVPGGAHGQRRVRRDGVGGVERG